MNEALIQLSFQLIECLSLDMLFLILAAIAWNQHCSKGMDYPGTLDMDDYLKVN